MRKLFSLCLSLCALVLVSASPVLAQNVLWVSPGGNDGNVCSQLAPCLTFQGAINKGSVAQINCLASGNYGTVTITASITIDCGSGNVGNIISSSSVAININAGSGVNVVLRHLSLNGLDTASNGILASGSFAGSLTIEDCTLQRYTGAAIAFVPSSGRGLLQISNSQIVNNGLGITAVTLNGQIASVILNRIEISGSALIGLRLDGNGVVAGTMRDSVVAAGSAEGVLAVANQVFFTIENSSIIANLSNGIHTTSAGANLNVTGSTISGNLTGINATAGSIVSFGNNTLNGNATNGAFTATVPLK
jgi:hypothetical protein